MQAKVGDTERHYREHAGRRKEAGIRADDEQLKWGARGWNPIVASESYVRTEGNHESGSS